MRTLFFLLGAGLLAGCTQAPAPLPPNVTNLLEARGNFKTQLRQQVSDSEPMPQPPEDLFSIVQFETELGPMNAMLSKPVATDQKQAAIIWITGGFPASGIGTSAWEQADPSNDQSAKVYRENGMIMMYPALRGCCGNPGSQEGFYGEVNDVIAAAKYLRSLDDVDADRIFLGGHSTGGTLALLTAAATDIFRGVISFGPIHDPSYYGPEVILYQTGAREQELRAPINYLSLIKTPTVVVEGSSGNIQALRIMKNAGKNSLISFVEVNNHDHFSVLTPVNAVLAQKISTLKAGDQLTLSGAEL